MERQNTADTFWQKVKIFPEGCWEWQGCCNTYGYGHFRTSERLFMARLPSSCLGSFSVISNPPLFLPV